MPTSVAFEFGVRVVGEAPLVVDRLDWRERLVERAAHIPAALLETDRYVRFGDGAVVRVEHRIGRADITALPDIRRAGRAAFAVAEAVRQRAARLAFTVLQRLQAAQPFRAREVRNLDVFSRALEAIEMNHDAPKLKLDQPRAGTLFFRRAKARVRLAHERPLQTLRRNAIVDQVHDTTDGVRTVEQGRRPAHHVDGLDRERLRADRMIGTDLRGIDRRDAVLQNTDAVFAQAANHRSARTRSEVSRADAGLAVERFADGRFEAQLEFFTGKNGDGLCLFEQVAAERGTGDDDALVHGGVLLVRRRCPRWADGVLRDAYARADDERERKQDGWFDIDSPED